MSAMTGTRVIHKNILIVVILSLLSLMLFSETLLADEKKALVADLPQEEALKLGERMYREGILPSGQPMQALVQGDVPVDGTMFSCMSCHLRSGLGSIEGRVITYPVDGNTLYRPMTKAWQLRWISGSRFARSTTGEIRSAYNDETLAFSIRGGLNPDGKTLNYVMPRYPLEDRDMEIMVYYLKNLSVKPSPGIVDNKIHFATIITEEGNPADRETMLRQLNTMINASKAGRSSKMAQQALASDPEALMNKGYINVSLSVWELKGPQEGWRKQLEAYYANDPVFALTGGIVNGDWRPIHQFCEENRIPCIFPLTDLPVVSDTDWYTLYFSKGFYQEGEAAAKYINSVNENAGDIPVIQVFRKNSAGSAAAKGFEETWINITGKAVENHMLSHTGPLTIKYLRGLAASNDRAVIMLWIDPSDLASLAALAGMYGKPNRIFLSYGLLKKDIYAIPENIRKLVYITYPYRLPDDFLKYEPQIKRQLPGQVQKDAAPEAQARMITLYSTVPTAIFMMKGYFVRDRFLEVLDMMLPMKTMNDIAPDTPLYPRISFGPGQRYVSKGCYIVQLSAGPVPKIINVSDWVIP